MYKWLLSALIFSWSYSTFAQTTPPAGPPWSDMCEKMEMAGASAIFKTPQCEAQFNAVYAQSSIEEIHTWMKANRLCFKEWAHFAWLAFSRNDMKMSELAWLHQVYLTNDRLTENSTCDDINCAPAEVAAILQKGVGSTISPDAVAHTNQFLDIVEQNTAYKESMDKAYAAVTPICLYHANLSCRPAMTQALDWMYPRSYKVTTEQVENMTFSMVEFYREIFADAVSQDYASKWALALLDLIQSGRYKTETPKALYYMGLEYFNGDEARFWRFMAVYATRGAAWATAFKMVHQDNKPIFAAFMLISAAMGILDTYYGEKGFAWSYTDYSPNTCFQPKPYHYWMAGGFSRLLREKNYSKTTSELVARILGAMYELGATNMGRKPDVVFFVPTFDTAVNRVRREVNHHYLGAKLGTRILNAPLESFDQSLLGFISASESLPEMSPEEMAEKIKDNLTKWQYWTALVGFYHANAKLGSFAEEP